MASSRLNWILRVSSIAVVSAVSVGASSAWAIQDIQYGNGRQTTGTRAAPKPGKFNSAPGAATPDASYDGDVVGCGQICEYEKANDNLSTQALYLVNKIAKLDEQAAIMKRYPADSDEYIDAQIAITKSAGDFCRDIPSQSVQDSTEACLRRYKDFQSVALVRIRQAMGRNEDAMAMLRSGRQADGSFLENGDRPVAAAGKSGAPVQPKAHVPEITTLKQLEIDYRKASQGAPKVTQRDRMQAFSQDLAGLSGKNPGYVDFSAPVAEDPSGQGTRSFVMKVDTPTGKSRDEREIVQKKLSVIADVQKDLQSDKSAYTGNVNAADTFKDQLSIDAYQAARNQIICKVQNDPRCQSAKKSKPVAAVIKKAPKTGQDSKGDPTVKPTPSPAPGAREPAQTSETVSGGDQPKNYVPYEKMFEPDAPILKPGSDPKGAYIRYDLDDLFKHIMQFAN